MNKDVYSLIGLMYRAGKLMLGDSALDNMSKVCYLVVSSDASDKTKERCQKKCAYYGIPCNAEFDGPTLSHALGKRNIKVVGLIDAGFRDSMLKKM